MTRQELLPIAKPILFNTEMVKAILEGRKTVTRRVVKLPNHIKQNANGLYTLFADGTCYENQRMEEVQQYIKPPYAAGNYLYIRETWSDHYVPNEDGKPELQYCYKADGIDLKAECLPGETNRWYPSIHMPKDAARIFLKVTDVRVERLQDITEEQALAEGIYPSNCRGCTSKMGCDTCPDEGYYEIDAFQYLWNSTIKKADLDTYGWDGNPWVWVIEFERIEV